MKPLQAFILNDTSAAHHHGCREVMRNLRRALRERGIEVAGTARSGATWWDDAATQALIGSCDVVVINGEGTLHDAAADAEAFLSVAVHPCRGNVPVVLVNSVFQNIPAAWGRYFEPLALISFRDSRSTAAYRTQFGGPAHTVHDLTFHCEAPAPRETAVPRGVAIGDSVHRVATRDLYRLYASLEDAVYLPIRPRTRRLRDPDRLTWKDRFDNLRYRARVDLRAMFEPTYRIVPDAAAFKRELGRVGLYVTGRFHGVCFAMMAGTPFRCVASNSHKIEALLSDAGLRAERLQPHGEIGRPDQGDWRFTESETHALQSFLARARDGNGALFDRIRDIARFYRERGASRGRDQALRERPLIASDSR